MDTLLELAFNEIHFCDYSMNTNEFIGHAAAESSGGDKVGAQVARKSDIEVSDLILILAPFLSTQVLL